ncbi:dynein heavy chain and region D6 of dynein motor-domain-containing protein [Gaertneriomyces semiglobifer]|nr:dynein heavy chain and region D6 of dynein motor-domain-containing protein [Gaertneriomyces semiglobifer]
MARIPKELILSYKTVCADLLEDVKDEYIESGKRCAVEWVLGKRKRDGATSSHPFCIRETQPRSTESPFPSAYRDAYLVSRAKLAKRLHVPHILALRMLEIWQHHQHTRLVDLKEVREMRERRVGGYRNLVLVGAEKGREQLVGGWWLTILKTFTEYFTKRPNRNVPLPNRPPSSFFRSFETLAYTQLYSTILSSIQDYRSLFAASVRPFSPDRTTVDITPPAPRFIVRLWLNPENKAIEYDPPLEEITDAVLQGLEYVATTVQGITRIENVVFGPIGEGLLKADTHEPKSEAKEDDQDVQPSVTGSGLLRLGSGTNDEFRVVVEENVVQSIAKELRSYCAKSFEMVHQYVKEYDKYSDIFSGRIDAEVDALLAESRPWDQDIVDIEKYRQLASEIGRNRRRVELPLVELNCNELHVSLSQLAVKISERFLGRVVEGNMEHQKRICARYESIEDRALRVPDNFKEMAELMEYMESIRTTELPSLIVELEEARRCLGAIISFSALTPAHIQLNNTTFTWPQRIIPILDRHNEIIGAAREKNEANLKERRGKFEADLEDFQRQVDELKDVGDLDEMPFYVKKVQTLAKQLQAAAETIATFNKEEQLFGWTVTVYPQRKQIMGMLEPYQALYSTAVQFQKSYKKWMDGNLLELDAEQIEGEVDGLKREIYRLLGGLVKDAAPQNIAKQVREKIDEFMLNLPMIHVLCNPGMRDRHWTRMSGIAEFDIKPDGTTTLRKMLKLGLEPYLTEFQEVSDAASKEYTLEKSMTKMFKEWEPLLFNLLPYRESGTFILSSVDDIQQLLDDQIVKTQSMRGSPYIKPFEQQIRDWERRLLTIQEILDEWLKVQATWLYLEPIFSSEDIMNQMPEEGRKFKMVDGSWRKIMATVNEDRRILTATEIPQLLDDLQKNNMLLEAILKGLNSYLEVKRLYFPRFFFLANDEMLEILSETKDPTRVQPHLKKCFEGIARLDFDDALNISALYSSEKERLELVQQVSTAEAKGSVEKWLSNVEKSMLKSVRYQIEEAYYDYQKIPRSKWVLDWPGQVVLCVSQIYWTLGVESAIREGKRGLEAFLQELNNDLNDIIQLVRGPLSKMARATLGALVVIDVHARDVVAQLVKEGLKDVNDFSWLAQLRYYWEEDTVMVRMINAQREYGYEYLGNSPRLVITPLTDRCYRTLFGALHLNLGGAPEGPAGTGKTETTKDLAKALAKQCVVFNCSDGLDYLAMGKFFKGLASSGAWACFDEFNRIDLEVLSVVAQQILTIQRAIAIKVKEFVFEGTKLALNPTCAVFITMNPGYAGRSELPDNLKALFRTVAMMVPDYTLIAEITLYSCGFIEARNLARKIAATYRLCSEQLSSQDHYDYGMRAVKSVLTAAGNLKLKYPDEDENVLVLRSIIDVNLPKFLSQDIALFKGIATDLFPGVQLPKPDYAVLEVALDNACKKMRLQNVPAFREKIIQLYEMMLVRHGFMLVGEPFGGKTCAYRVLAEALTELGIQDEHKGAEAEWLKVQYRVINPKAVPMGQLYGQFDPVSHEWTDGVLATTFRNFANSTNPDRKWVIFDGPVDAVWIENMNTVLDDNKKLCLMSGEIIQLSNTMSLVFEVMDLAAASPATVSRCGMVYLEPERLGWKPIMISWLQGLSYFAEPQLQHLQTLFVTLLPPCLQSLRRECKELAPTTDIGLVSSLIRLLDSTFDDFRARDAAGNSEDPTTKQRLESRFVFTLLWSVGGSIDSQSQVKFDASVKRAVQRLPEPITVPLPAEGTLYDYVFQVGGKDEWVSWLSTVETTPIPANAEFSDIIIPTKDTARYNYLMDLMISHDVGFLLVGPTGTGKSKYISSKLLNGVSKETYIPMFINFSARTSASQTQDIVMSKLDKRRKGVFGAPVGKRMLIFIDDLNMPAKEQYGAQPPIELFRQWLDHGNWYDKKDTSKIELIDIQLLAAMGPPGGGRNVVTPRFQRHFNQIVINTFDEQTMSRIFTTILDWHFGRMEFTEEIRTISLNIVDATTSIFQWVVSNLLPTPAKTHYTFNLRDFARVIQGLLLSRPHVFQQADQIIRLWTHEVYRVYYDRLVTDDDRFNLFSFVLDVVKDKFERAPDEVFERIASETDSDGKKMLMEDDMRNLMFGDLLGKRGTNAEPDYAELTDYAKVTEVIQVQMGEHNQMKKNKLNLVLFRFAVEHVSRICRILKLPGGNALLVGVGGSGRQSLSRLAAFMCQCELYQIEISKSYSKMEWREDLKKMLIMAGADNKKTVFLFSDTQVKEESFIEDISNLLNSGDVPNLFAPDERQNVIDRVMSDAQEQGKAGDGTPTALYNYFIDRVRNNLHIILCMSPIGDAFRARLRQFSSLVNCCTIDWFQAWPDDALQAVARQFLKDVDLEDAVRESVVQLCKHFHQSTIALSERFLAASSRHNYVTPTSYLELLRAYKTLLQAKREEVSAIKRRYVGGLDKLQFAAEQIERMQQDLTNLTPQLKRTSEETVEMLTKIEKESKEVEATKETVSADEAVAAQKAEQAEAIKRECENNLAEALPLLNAALAALDTLKKPDIDLVKSMKNPPEGVKLVMEAVCVMKDIKPDRIPDPSGSGKMVFDYWKTSLKLLGDPKFLDSLKAFDKDDIQPHVIKAIRTKYIPNPEFKPEKVRNASSAAEGLCNWIIAMEAYDRVAKVVAPKQIALAHAEAELAETMAGLAEKRAQLKSVMDRLQALNDNLQALSEKKERLEKEVKSCEEQLERAQTLLGGLGGEKQRWTEVVKSLDITLYNLPGDILLSAGVVAYLGPFTKLYRQDCITQWITTLRQQKPPLPCSSSFSLSTTLGDPIVIRNWNIAGLPSDAFSVDNGIIVKNSRRWPLMIDPQGQANRWVRNMEKDNNLQIIKLTDSDYVRNLENAIQFGAPVLLENVKEELDPILDSVLQKATFKSGGATCIRLGDAVIEWSESFRLYITTNLPNPHYLPEVAVKVSLLNFMITPEGLEDQLLGIVVTKERPDLEAEKTQLILTNTENLHRLKETEDKILEILSSSEGNILENETAIEVLKSSQTLSRELGEKQKISEETERKIDETRNSYRPIANHSSVLYFCIADLASIDPMYQYSLPWFIDLFITSISASTKSSVLKRRLKNLEQHFTYNLYLNICRSLFERDKLVFSFLLCTSVLRNRGDLDPAEFGHWLTGGVGIGSPPPNPDPEAISNKQWSDIFRLSTLKAFQALPQQLAESTAEWKGYLQSTSDTLPPPWDTTLSDFQKMLIVRAVRPEKMIPAVQEFVKVKLGHKFIEPPTFDLAASYEDANHRTPLVFVLSPGVDPMAGLLKFAESKGFSSKLQSISLGQGQGPIASSMVKEAQRGGSWVVLQNCHLAISWLPTLEKMVDDMTAEVVTVHKDFRLWLTSYPSPKFPASVLMNSVKMTNEPPKGLRANLLRSYLSDPITDPSYYDSVPTKETTFHKLLFSLCTFHAVIQERRNFGPLGWNIPYEFNESDLRISMRQLAMFLNEYEEVPFKALSYLTGECNYGGRVTDDWDRRTLMSLLANYYNPNVIDDPNYKFSPSGVYYPPTGTYDNHVEFIKQLPMNQSPDVFGIHDNGDIERELSETKGLFESITKTQERSLNASGGKSSDETLLEICTDILSRVPGTFDIEMVVAKYPVKYEESLNTVLVQELIRFNRLITTILVSLVNVQKALKGLVVMSAELEEVCKSILMNRIPAAWAAKSYPSLKPLGSYITDLCERIKMFKKWIDEGPGVVFWLSGFFFTQSFITAVLQNYSRSHTLPIDTLTLSFHILPTIPTSSPEIGAYVTGLHLTGASYTPSLSSLTEQAPKVLYDSLPVMWFKPIQRVDEDKEYTGLVYECPVYKTSARRGILSTTGHSTNFVLSIKLPTRVEPRWWVLRGVAAL